MGLVMRLTESYWSEKISNKFDIVHSLQDYATVIQVRTDHLGLSKDLHHGHIGFLGQLLFSFCENTTLDLRISWVKIQNFCIITENNPNRR